MNISRFLLAARLRILCALLCLMVLMCLGGRIAGAQGVIGGGSTTLQITNVIPNAFPVDPNDPRLYTWGQNIDLSGTGWASSEIVTIYMHGPLNTLGVAPTDRAIGTVLTFPDGTIGSGFNQFVTIPYDNGVTGYLGTNMPSIPRPGNYEIHAVGVHAGINPLLDRASAGLINLCPQPLAPFFGAPFWQFARGGRDGFLGEHSPERVDPEWLSVWSKQPVAFYATVAEVGLQGGDQPAFISHDEYPGTHYAHDLNLDLVPDLQYRWVLSRSNFANDPGAASHGRIEWGWETQNAGNPFTYGTGNIGIPLWATPTAGDRVYTVGRWAMDNGHPDSGDRTEIHPPRLLATMRERNTAVPLQRAMTRASQVDIYVSGHGGGANQYYDGLEDLLDNKGLGGGRIQDFMPNLSGNSLVYDTYYKQGPLDDSGLVAVFLAVYPSVPGSSVLVWSVAGPSGIATDTTGLPTVWDHSMPPPAGAWVIGPEERPVNDMDYDFDVPLPVAPAGASSPQVLVTTHPEHTTGITEAITYTNPDPTTGLPTGAHIHLPYNGADSGIYARTLKFYWDQFSPPGEHFVVQINDVNNTNPYDRDPHTWNFWTDVCGQWLLLSGLNGGFVSKNGDKITGLDAAKFDVYLDYTDLLRVFAVGYEVHSLDYFYGFSLGGLAQLFGVPPAGVNQTLLPAYRAGINIAENVRLYGGSDDGDIGGALFSRAPYPIDTLVGPHNVAAQPVAGSSQFNVDFTITHVAATTTTTLTSSKNPSTYGDPVTFTAAVTNTSTGATPTGTLVITIDGSPVAATISSFGTAMTATYSTATLPTTSLHTVTATYTNVDGNFGPSGPASLTQTVTLAPLTIRADNASRLVDAPNPTFSATYSGFVNGDTAASLSGTLNCMTTATMFSPVGSYPINCSGQTSPNYVITYVPGTLTVTATAASIGNLIGDLFAALCIDNSGIVNALASKLAAAQAAISGGNIQTAINTLAALKNQISAQAGKHIATSCTIGGVGFNPATILLLDVQGLIDSLRVSTIADPITGYVVNASGVGVFGTTVSILDAGGNTVAIAAPDITGYYFFATTGVLVPGSSYTVAVTGLPAGFVTSTPAASPAFTWAGTGMTIGNFVLN